MSARSIEKVTYAFPLPALFAASGTSSESRRPPVLSELPRHIFRASGKEDAALDSRRSGGAGGTLADHDSAPNSLRLRSRMPSHRFGSRRDVTRRANTGSVQPPSGRRPPDDLASPPIPWLPPPRPVGTKSVGQTRRHVVPQSPIIRHGVFVPLLEFRKDDPHDRTRDH